MGEVDGIRGEIGDLGDRSRFFAIQHANTTTTGE